MAGPTDVEDYLAGLPDDQGAALEKLRKTIRAAAPEATETISYQMPTFKLSGRVLVHYAAFKDHYSLFPRKRGGHGGTRGGTEALLRGEGHAPLHPRQAHPSCTREERSSRRGSRRTQRADVAEAMGTALAVLAAA